MRQLALSPIVNDAVYAIRRPHSVVLTRSTCTSIITPAQLPVSDNKSRHGLGTGMEQPGPTLRAQQEPSDRFWVSVNRQEPSDRFWVSVNRQEPSDRFWVSVNRQQNPVLLSTLSRMTSFSVNCGKNRVSDQLSVESRFLS